MRAARTLDGEQADPARACSRRPILFTSRPVRDGRPHADRRAWSRSGHRQLRQGPAQRHRLGIRQGRLQASPTRSWCCGRRSSRATSSPSTSHVLEGSLGKADGPASVFIDTIWFGIGSNGFNYSARARRPAARRRRSAIRTAPAPSPAGPIRRRPVPTWRHRATTARRPAPRRRPTSTRATSSSSTSRPAASPRCFPATEARHEPHPLPGRAGPDPRRDRAAGDLCPAAGRPATVRPPRRSQDRRPAAAAAHRAVDDRAQRPGRQARRRQAGAGGRLAQRHHLRRPSRPLGRPRAHRAPARGMGRRCAGQLRQGRRPTPPCRS